MKVDSYGHLKADQLQTRLEVTVIASKLSLKSTNHESAL